MTKTGQAFPDFRLANQDGKERSLKDYKGKWLVLYFYPKDDTPGCTIQGKSFTAQKAAFDELNVSIVGVSADDVKSHKDFCSKYSFTIELLADPSAQLLQSAGVTQSEHKGTKYWDRTTFVVDPQGTLVKTYEKVNPQGHEETLLKDLAGLQKK
jgi:peroxiredoxin Q/BCP